MAWWTKKQPDVNWSYKAVLKDSCSPSLSLIFILKLESDKQKWGGKIMDPAFPHHKHPWSKKSVLH